MTGKQKKMLARIIVAAALTVGLYFAPVKGLPRFLLYLIPYLIIGYDVLLKAFRGIRHFQVFNENFLMAVATIGAMALALYTGTGDFTEAIAVILFYQVGEFFQSYALGRSRRNIAELMDIRPDYANVWQDGETVTTDPDEVAIGSVIVVNPGEKVPIDGVVLEGASSLNTAALTGESIPRDCAAGDEIISGCINLSGMLKIRTTKAFGESTVSKILDLVENASSRKSKSENFITKFARVYTPAVVLAAVALAVLPPLVRQFAMNLTPEWGSWVYRALTFLVISCPCALVISIPLSFFAGIGGASKAGILVKGSNYLETLSKTRTVVFDKTGTLTQGAFEVNAVHHNTLEDKKIIEYAALIGHASSHPISRSIVRAHRQPLETERVSKLREIAGEGIIAEVDGVEVATGNDKLMARVGVRPIDCHSVGAIIHVAIGGSYAGHILITDVIKPHAKDAIRSLHHSGVKQTIMLTGDDRRVADNVAESLDLDAVYAELLPGDKVNIVERLLKEKPEHDKLAYVGDGINDAPVLRRADIGIAMGAMGSDAAIEAADIVLMDDDPMKIAKAMRISRRTLRIVYQNIVMAIGIKLIVLIMGAIGLASMWLAIFADVGVMILAVLNAIRALFVKN